MVIRHHFSIFYTLLRSITYQQLAGAAAAKILSRVEQCCAPDGKQPTPDQVLCATDEALRGAGLSRNKLAAIRDLAAKTLDGTVPDLKEIRRMKSAAGSVASADKDARTVKGVKVLAQRADNLERPQLRTLVDNLRNKLGSGVVIIGSVADGKVALIVGVTKDLTAKVQAGKVVGQIAKAVGGSGGGRPDLAEAGGKDPEALDKALSESYGVVESML